jgi:hypothetical protein
MTSGLRTNGNRQRQSKGKVLDGLMHSIPIITRLHELGGTYQLEPVAEKLKQLREGRGSAIPFLPGFAIAYDFWANWPLT